MFFQAVHLPGACRILDEKPDDYPGHHKAEPAWHPRWVQGYNRTGGWGLPVCLGCWQQHVPPQLLRQEKKRYGIPNLYLTGTGSEVRDSVLGNLQTDLSRLTGTKLKRGQLNVCSVYAVLRIRDVYPGSRIRFFSIPNPYKRI